MGMPLYTATVEAPSRLVPVFERLLDVLPNTALVGDESSERVEFLFDVRADDERAARNKAFRVAMDAADGEAFTVGVKRQPGWFKRLLGARWN